MSTVYEKLHQHHGESCAEQKLKVVRAELVRPVKTVQAATALLKQIDPDVVKRLPENISPDEFEHVIGWLAEAGADLQEILDALAAECPETEAHRTN